MFSFIVKHSLLISLLTLLILFGAGLYLPAWVSGLVGNVVEVRWAGWGSAAAFVSAIFVSFAVGYAVNRGVGKLSRK